MGKALDFGRRLPKLLIYSKELPLLNRRWLPNYYVALVNTTAAFGIKIKKK
jgi:hypothetical protein